MRIRLFIGNLSVKSIFKEWLKFTYPNCDLTGLAAIDCRTYFKDLSQTNELETLNDFLELAAYIPRVNNEQVTLNIFITEDQLPNVELQEKLAKFPYPLHYYQVSLTGRDTFCIKFHHESSSYFYSSSDSFRLAGIQYKKDRDTFKLHPFKFSLGHSTFETSLLRPYIKKICSTLLYANINSKQLDVLVREATYNRKHLQEKIIKILKVNNRQSLSAMSYLRLWQYYQKETIFDENLFFSFLEKGIVLPVYFDLREKTKNLYQIIPFTKMLHLLSKERHNLKNYIAFDDTVTLASHYNENFSHLREMLTSVRIRSLRQIHDLLSDESYYQRIFYEEKVAQSFSELQGKFLRLHQKNFIIPQNLVELKTQAKLFKNCSILYARDVANSRGFLGYMYKDEKPFACIFFDHYRNIIEVSGVANVPLSEGTRTEVQESLYQGRL